jgi:DNA helicase-4
MIVSRDQPEPIRSIVESLSDAASGNAGVILTENAIVNGTPIAHSTSRRSFTIREAVNVILSYDAVKRVLDHLVCGEEGVRVNWQKPDPEIAALSGDFVSTSDVQNAKTAAIQEWFFDLNLGLPSDEQAAVIGNCHNSLKVVARAGSGKTRTIAQKILFLIHFLGFNYDEVIALVFNRNAKEELEARLHQYERDAGLTASGAFKVLTFDALAYNLVKPQATPLGDSGQRKLIHDIVLNAIDDEEGLRQQVEELMVNSFKGDWEKSLRLNAISSQVDLDRLRSCLTEETMDGKEVKSRAEKRIADFLFEHDIPYRYEMPFSVGDGNVIRPDFYIPTHKVVIEYYGLRGEASYELSIDYKRQYWNSRADITLIEINPEFICKHGSSFDNSRDEDYQALSNLLSDRTVHLENSIQPERLSDYDVLAKLRNRIRLTFAELLQSAIARVGQMNSSDVDFMAEISRYQATSEEERNFLDLLPSFVSMYRDHLLSNNLTDFNQIKKEAIGLLSTGSTVLSWDQGTNGIDLKSVKYVFVDEFQDFSDLFRELLLAILKVAPGALVNAVGDDWQMINRFAGSKPELFEQFEADYPRPMTTYLQTNYRSSGGLVEFCNNIMLMNGVVGKPSIACDSKRREKYLIARLDRDFIDIAPREVHYFKGDSVLASIFRLYKSLTERFPIGSRNDKDKICFAISRSNNPPVRVNADELGISARTKRDVINVILDRLTPNEVGNFFEAITGHKAKGLEADAVVVLQPRQYPTIHRRSIFLQFFGDTPENLLRDELNLFYVTCSRAKQHLFFLSENCYMTSPFVGHNNPFIKTLLWDLFPCRLKCPATLHTILIQSGDQDSGALYSVADLLVAHGFTRFSRPNQIPTRSQLIRHDLFNSLTLLNRVVQSCSQCDLKYIILDGRNHEIFRLPGPISIRQAMDQCRGG